MTADNRVNIKALKQLVARTVWACIASAITIDLQGTMAIAKPYSPPNLTPTQIPTAFLAEWGNYFVSGSVYGFDNVNPSQWVTDGCINLGVGIGNARKAVAVEFDYNQDSVSGRESGGSFDVRVGRDLINTSTFRLAVSGGWLAVASYGDVQTKGDSPYGVITAALPLRPNDPSFRQTLQLNVGGGGGRFQRIDSPNLVSDGVFASAGVEVAPNLGISAGWAGRGLNAGISLAPVKGIPLWTTVSGVNLTNTDNAGRAAVFSVTWGGTFRTATF
jgi:hypothetical protein